jgi:hypothetical protein
MKNLNEFLNEAKQSIPDFKMGVEIIDFLDEIPALKKFRNDVAQYDDTYFTIPIKDWNKNVGWSVKEVDAINDKLDNYEGSISHDGKFFYVQGAA